MESDEEESGFVPFNRKVGKGWKIDCQPDVHTRCETCYTTYLRNDHDVCPFCADIESESEYFTDYGCSAPATPTAPIEGEGEEEASIAAAIEQEGEASVVRKEEEGEASAAIHQEGDETGEEKEESGEGTFYWKEGEEDNSTLLDTVHRRGRPKGSRNRRRGFRLCKKKYDWKKQKKG